MDDLSAMIAQILSDPDSAKQLQEAAAALGLTGNQPIQEPPRQETHSQQQRGRQSQQGRRQNNVRSSMQQQRQQPTLQPVQQETPSISDSADLDLSALSQLLSGIMAESQPAPPQEPQTPDLSGLASLLGSLGINNTPAPQQQPDLSALAGLLGGTQQPASTPTGLDALLSGLQNSSNTSNPGSGGLDLSALSGLLGGLGGGNNQATQQAMPDLSALSGLLGGLGGGSQQSSPDSSAGLGGLAGLLGGAGQQQSGNNSSVSALANMLGGGAQPSTGGVGGFDIGMLMKVQQAMATMSANQDNVRLLMGLKSRLQTDRAKKVDDAIRVMQLIQFLPLLKETGIFSGLESLMGGFGLDGIGNLLGGSSGNNTGAGGLGSLLGNLGGNGLGLGNLLGGLNLFRGR